jgi:hypothetical protein
MKKIFASLLSLSVTAVSCTFPNLTPSPTTTPPPHTDPFDAAWDDLSIFKDGLIPSAQSSLSELEGASIYRIHLKIADDLLRLNGSMEVRYTNMEDVPLHEIHFRLYPNLLGGKLTVHQVQVEDTSVAAQYELGHSLMIVPLRIALEPGQDMVIRVDFSVWIPDSLEMNYGVLAYVDNVLALAHAYPMIAVYDDEGWNEEIPSPNGDLTYADASFYLVRIIAPRRVTLVTSGIKISLNETGQDQVLTVAGGPARDFYLAASPEYEETSQTFGEITIRSYAPAGYEQGSQSAVEIAARAVEVFSGRYTAYPYRELDLVVTPTRALGIEYPGMIAITSWTYDLNDPRTRDTLEATVVHEVGHQWFYNLIGDDQLDDPWLDESLTQFAVLQYYSDVYGAQGYDGFRDSLENRWARVEFANIPIGLPVADYRDAEYAAIVYGRGPLFFVALREAMGADAFDAFLREYAVSLSWAISTPETLLALAEKNCACNLDPFFNEWVYPNRDR